MNEKSELINKLCCKICNKIYKSKSSLCNHNKKFHNDNVINSNINIINSNNNVINSNYLCRYCNKEYKLRQYRWSHEKTCKIKPNKDIEEKKLELEEKKLLLQIKKEETKILQLKLKLERSTKIDNITLKKLNKMLMERNNKIKNINTINNNNSNNQIINNFNLVGFGKEEVFDALTYNDKRVIMNAKYNSLDKLIEIVHCGKYNQFKNIIITNMKDNYIYKFDDKVGHFILSTKIEILNSLIDCRMYDLEVIYNDLLEKNKLDDKTKDIIEKFINKINIDSKYIDYDGKEHPNFKEYKINEVKVLLYNNQDKITNDISLLLTTNEVSKELVI